MISARNMERGATIKRRKVPFSNKDVLVFLFGGIQRTRRFVRQRSSVDDDEG